jgi:hypothetical protein
MSEKQDTYHSSFLSRHASDRKYHSLSISVDEVRRQNISMRVNHVKIEVEADVSHERCEMTVYSLFWGRASYHPMITLRNLEKSGKGKGVVAMSPAWSLVLTCCTEIRPSATCSRKWCSFELMCLVRGRIIGSRISSQAPELSQKRWRVRSPDWERIMWRLKLKLSHERCEMTVIPSRWCQRGVKEQMFFDTHCSNTQYLESKVLLSRELLFLLYLFRPLSRIPRTVRCIVIYSKRNAWKSR